MGLPRRNSKTDQYQIVVEWDALNGDDTRGSPITSYYM